MAAGAEQLLVLLLCLIVCQSVPYKLLFGVSSLHVKPRSQQDLAGGHRLVVCQVFFQRGIITQPGVMSRCFTFSCLFLWLYWGCGCKPSSAPHSTTAQLLLWAGHWVPARRGMLQGIPGLLVTTSKEQQGQRLCLQLKAPLLAWISSQQSQIHLA